MKIKGTINWVAPEIGVFNKKRNISFKIRKDFYNIYGEEKNLIEAKKSLTVGNEVEFDFEKGQVANFKMLNVAKPKPASEKSSDMIKIQGKDYMTYKGLLSKAHAKDKTFNMEITEKFVSEDMKKAWCIVRLTSGKRIFDGFGSSTPENTGAMTQTHPVEMAHTRAKGRALRDFLNIGEVMAEELKK